MPVAGMAEENSLLATFYVRDTLWGLDASAVQEVIRVGPMTGVRNAPPEVAGIVNLRGRIVTILDIGKKLGFQKPEPGPENRIFIVEDRGEFIGLLVDRGGEVVEAGNAERQPPPPNVPPEQARYLTGVCRTGGKVIALMDAAKMLSATAPRD
jgi:purine-binding chemotaxis protein CheW